MFHSFSNSKGQASSSEYVITFFLVVSMIVAMTVYFRRAVQGRIVDARTYMVKQTIDAARSTDATFYGNLHIEYEPYYGNTESSVTRDSSETRELLQGGTSGIFRKAFNESTQVQTNSTTAAPIEAR